MTKSEVADHIYENDVFLVVYKDEKAIGFGGLKYNQSNETNEKIAYLSAGVISKEFQNMGLYNELVKLRIDAALAQKVYTITTRTQNPIVEFTIKRDLNKRVARLEIEGFSVTRTIVKGAFGRRLTANSKESSDETINKEYEKLNLDNGDAYYLKFTLTIKNDYDIGNCIF